MLAGSLDCFPVVQRALNVYLEMTGPNLIGTKGGTFGIHHNRLGKENILATEAHNMEISVLRHCLVEN